MVNTVSMNVFIDIRHMRQHYGLNDYYVSLFKYKKCIGLKEIWKKSATVIWDFHVPL